VPARRILQGMRNDRAPPLLAVDLDQFIDPGRDGLLPQMADCRSSPVERAKRRCSRKTLQILSSCVLKSAAPKAVVAAASKRPSRRGPADNFARHFWQSKVSLPKAALCASANDLSYHGHKANAAFPQPARGSAGANWRQRVHVCRCAPAPRSSAYLYRHGRRQRRDLPLLLDTLSL
jgi:hypothetical protein